MMFYFRTWKNKTALKVFTTYRMPLFHDSKSLNYNVREHKCPSQILTTILTFYKKPLKALIKQSLSSTLSTTKNNIIIAIIPE